MPTSPLYEALRAIALTEFPDIVVDAQIMSLPTNNEPAAALRTFLEFARGMLLGLP